MRIKVYIIDEAHMLTKEGANAFLKTLEEPPAHAVFILATTAPETLPATILSRCQRYAFRRIAIPVMIERMREIADAEEIAIDDAALGAIAYRADGGLRDALTMLEQVAALPAGTVDAADRRSGVRSDRPRTSRAGCSTRRSRATPRRRCATIDDASDAGTDMHGADPLADRRVSPPARRARRPGAARARSRARGCAARGASAPRTSRKRARARVARCSSEALGAARTAATRGWSSRPRCCVSSWPSEDPTLDALAARVTAIEEARR